MSLISVTVESLLGTLLILRGKYANRDAGQDLDFRYAFFMFSIAAMESQQGLLWWNCGEDLKENMHLNFLLSLGIWVSAWVEIPISIALLVPKFENFEEFLNARGKKDSDPGYAKTPFKNFVVMNGRRIACTWFFAQALAVLVLIVAHEKWYTLKGPNGHQIWTCAQAMDAFFCRAETLGAAPSALMAFVREAGYPVACTLYCCAIGLSLSCHPSPLEVMVYLIIGTVTFGYSWYMLARTLEACSVWCWSTICYGLWFVMRPSVKEVMKTQELLSGNPEGDIPDVEAAKKPVKGHDSADDGAESTTGSNSARTETSIAETVVY